VRITILGSGGGLPSRTRETTSVLVRDGDATLLLDAGTGARRLVTDPAYLDGVAHVDIALTHFHLDHVYALPYLSMLPVTVAVWAPGEWLYGTSSAAILAPLLRPPLAPEENDVRVEELRAGHQPVGEFVVRASPQPRHWSPSAGLRVGDHVALVTDTPYETTSAALADGVEHLLHEAWSSSPAEHHSTGADAARVAQEARVGQLTLVHLNPRFTDHTDVLEDAAARFEAVRLGEDEQQLA
jgi:ribonuclease BN (tRNA processing enzyme)